MKKTSMRDRERRGNAGSKMRQLIESQLASGMLRMGAESDAVRTEESSSSLNVEASVDDDFNAVDIEDDFDSDFDSTSEEDEYESPEERSLSTTTSSRRPHITLEEDDDAAAAKLRKKKKLDALINRTSRVSVDGKLESQKRREKGSCVSTLSV